MSMPFFAIQVKIKDFCYFGLEKSFKSIASNEKFCKLSFSRSIFARRQANLRLHILVRFVCYIFQAEELKGGDKS